MTIICRYYPTRTKPRYFQPCDVARIARNCVADNPDINRYHVMGCTLRGMGFKYICLTDVEYKEAVHLKNNYYRNLAKLQADEIIDANKQYLKDAVKEEFDEIIKEFGVGEFVDTSKVPQDVTRGTGTTLKGRLGAAVAALAVLAGIIRSLTTDTAEDTTGRRRCYPVGDVIIESRCKCKRVEE